jgi:hypothetical protein
MILYEWRPKLQRRKNWPPVLSLEPVEGSCFRSVYGYPEETANLIKSNGHVGGLKGKVVQSSLLFVDVDEDENVEQVEKAIADLCVSFSKWTTGNRGAHFHIDTESITDSNLPYSQAEFIRNLGIDDLVDMSIYRHHSIFRVPGALHQDTGKPKTCLYQVDGEVLSIPIVEEPEPEYSNTEHGDPESIRIFKKNLLQRRSVGGRHMHLYILFESGMRAGHDIDSMLDYLLWWNAQQRAPHPEEVVHKKWKGFVNGQKKIHTNKSYGSLSF